MALTEEDKNEILNAIKAESQSVDELTQVASLDGVNTLPAMRGTELVSAPVSLLSKPATDAAATANAAATNATNAASQANSARDAAANAAAAANTAASNANAAADTANAAADQIEDYLDKVVLALHGATARIDGIVENATFSNQGIGANQEVSVIYVRSAQKFGFLLGTFSGDESTVPTLCGDWNDERANLFMNDARTAMLKDKVYLYNDTLLMWSDEEGDIVEISGSGSGAGFYNVTNEQPRSSGYYDKDTAIAALENAKIDDDKKFGMILTFESAAGVWQDYRFIGSDLDSFLTPASWEEYGSGKIKSITFNGSALTPDSNGNVAIVMDQIEVDESLSTESDNPVQNSAVTSRINQLDDKAIANIDIEEDDGKNILKVYNSKGGIIASAEFTGGGGGTGTSTVSKIVVTASIDKAQVKEGGSATLTYSYNHVDADGVTDGVKGTLTITVMRGSTTTYSETINNVSAGTVGTLDLTPYLLAGTVDVYVRADAVTAEGTPQTKQAYTNISVVTLQLTSGYNLASGVSNGGYKNTDTISIPYTINGTGTKDVMMYLDGADTPTVQTVNRSGTVNGEFLILASQLTAGRHTVQLVAERSGLLSDSIYIDILKAGSTAPFFGIKYTDTTGTILHETHLTPTLQVGQYEQLEFEYIAYDPNKTPASVTEYHNGSAVKTLSVPRSMQSYTNRFTSQGVVAVSFVCRTTTYNLNVNVVESDVAVGEATQGLILRLLAAGRSNDEENPAVWTYDDITTDFENVDWKSSGWDGEALILKNGAKAIINALLFSSDIAATGGTIEMEVMVSNVLDRTATVISSLSGTKGFQVTAEEASQYTGSTKPIEDDEGNTTYANVGVSSKFASGMRLKIAFVVSKRTDGRLIELYINGIRSKADIYSEDDIFQQSPAVPITFDSTYADLAVYSVRAYNRALSDDEELSNYIVDRPTSTEMSDLFLKNDVMNETGTSISLDKLRSKGKGVMLIVRENGLDPVNAENNKSTDFSADIYFYSPFGSEYDFVLKDCYIRIQGTSSTKYPRKNYRIYFAKGSNPILYINGVEQTATGSDGKRKNKYTMRPGAIPMNLFCMKADYSDSSMTLNTGSAKLFNDIMKELGLLTPPQRIDSSIRGAIDGFPIDIFAAESLDADPQYYGQYNFNNEKSKSTALFGQSGVDGIDEDACITLEFLNNTQPLCLFQGKSDMEAQMVSEFDKAIEFNNPDDCKWAGASDDQRAAILRLWEWVRDCVPATADTTNYTNLSSFVSQKFKDEVANYFDVNYLLTYYLFTDYGAMVDQRAKNILLRTWDLQKWYPMFYDGDTAYGLRNDSFLAYLYTVARGTWDSDKGKYAFEGHDSWLWCLVLANLQDELKSCAAALREKLTAERALAMYNDEQAGNWSERQYNKSGEFKYIIPQTEGVIVKSTLTKYPYIYALQGSRAAHREHFITNRYALLDAQYETGAYQSDNIDMYLSRTANEAANTIDITANEIYYFGYGTNNQPSLQASQKAEAGESVTLTFTNAFTVNDPIRVYGASRIRELDMTGVADNITGDINLNKCTVLRKLNISTNGTGSSGWCIVLDKCASLTEINLNGQGSARTGTLSSSELNFSNQTRLERMQASGVNVNGVVFAEGAPLTYVKLPSSLKTLRLEYLPNLTMTNLIIEGYSNIENFRFASCPNLNWQTLLSRCVNVQRIRVTGIDMEGDGSELQAYLDKGGLDADGNATDTCALVGTYRLTKYIDEDVVETYRAHYPELNIVLPEYTTICFDDSIADSANITNLDNNTGYDSTTGAAYTPSGHISKILAQRHRVLAKKTATKQVTVFPLHDENSNFFADADDTSIATAADLTGAQGNVMMYEPHYWYKGINDFLNKKKYALFSSNEECPTRAETVVLQKTDLTTKTGYAVRTGSDYTTLAESEVLVSADSYCTVNVEGYKQVRWPSLNSSIYGAIFLDADNNIVKRCKVKSDAGMLDGMYCFTDIPDDAVKMAFTISNAAAFDCVVLTKSEELEAIEPDWVEHEECLIGVYEAYVSDDFPYSISGVVSTGSVNIADFKVYARNRGTGWQLIDYEMHKDVGNLFFAAYGERDSQGTCGYGSSSYTRTNGASNAYGMQDTFADPSAPTGQYAYQWTDKDAGTKVNINSPVVMGYENWQGNKAEWMEIDFNKTKVDYIWRSPLPDGTEREIQGLKSTGDLYPKNVIHGRYMDTLVAASGGSTSSYYFDDCNQSSSTARVVSRSHSSAGADGGVSYANARYDSASVYAYIGSRLAFRGDIIFASTASAFKAISEID